MKRASLIAGIAIVLLANGIALAHAWRNMSGPVDADIILTQRELGLSYNSADEDSGVALNLNWNPTWLFPSDGRPPWLDRQHLSELDFDTSVSPSDLNAAEFYQRQRGRSVFVAMEYNGPAWLRRLESWERQTIQQRQSTIDEKRLTDTWTRLVAVDSDSDPDRLRARHTDRSSVIILPAVIRIHVITIDHAPLIAGMIEEVPTSIHVPPAFSDGFRRLPADRKNVRYQVHLRYGVSHEPWIVGVEFMPSGPSPESSPALGIAPPGPPPGSER